MFPNLSGGLTEILVGGSYRGVSLDATIFREPSQPLAARGRTTTEARAMVAAERDKRFACTLQSVDRLIQWTNTERHMFERMLQFRQRPTRNPIAQGDGLLEVADVFAYLESAVTPSTKDEADEQDDEFDLELHMPIRCFAH
jgi:hypothetical protein